VALSVTDIQSLGTSTVAVETKLTTPDGGASTATANVQVNPQATKAIQAGAIFFIRQSSSKPKNIHAGTLQRLTARPG